MGVSDFDNPDYRRGYEDCIRHEMERLAAAKKMGKKAKVLRDSVGDFATCPLCGNPVAKDLTGTDPSVAYMDGWHHKVCLDDYLRTDEV